MLTAFETPALFNVVRAQAHAAAWQFHGPLPSSSNDPVAFCQIDLLFFGGAGSENICDEGRRPWLLVPKTISIEGRHPWLLVPKANYIKGLRPWLLLGNRPDTQPKESLLGPPLAP